MAIGNATSKPPIARVGEVVVVGVVATTSGVDVDADTGAGEGEAAAWLREGVIVGVSSVFGDDIGEGVGVGLNIGKSL